MEVMLALLADHSNVSREGKLNIFGFGFEFRHGGKHTIYIHPEFQELRAIVARHSSLPVGYIQHAINLIDKLKKLKEEVGSK